VRAQAGDDALVAPHEVSEKHVNDLPTPALVIDLDVAAQPQALAGHEGQDRDVPPHAKAQVAGHRQDAAASGARGPCAAKLGEADVWAAASRTLITAEAVG
jgi:D-serine deaminase-like pyridoxal phosphate-dependent protein